MNIDEKLNYEIQNFVMDERSTKIKMNKNIDDYFDGWAYDTTITSIPHINDIFINSDLEFDIFYKIPKEKLEKFVGKEVVAFIRYFEKLRRKEKLKKII